MLKAAGESGDPLAGRVLGNLFYFGANGVPKNITEAIKWYSLAALAGDPEAKLHLERITHAETKRAELPGEPSLLKPLPPKEYRNSALGSAVSTKNRICVVLIIIFSFFTILTLGSLFKPPLKSSGGELTVITSPSSCSIFLNDTLVGQSPIRIQSLSYGSYELKVVKENFTTATKTALIASSSNFLFIMLLPTRLPSLPKEGVLFPQELFVLLQDPSSELQSSTTIPVASIQPNGDPSISGQATASFVSGDNVILRESPQILPTNKIGLLKFNQKVKTVSSQSQEDGFTWFFVNVGNGENGWVRGDFLNSKPNEKMAFRDSNSNVRSGPSIEFPIIDTPQVGTKFVVTDQNEKWLKIRYGKVSVGWTSKSNFKKNK